jgi:hypothetical protein
MDHDTVAPVFAVHRHSSGGWSVIGFDRVALSRRLVHRIAAFDEPDIPRAVDSLPVELTELLYPRAAVLEGGNGRTKVIVVSCRRPSNG